MAAGKNKLRLADLNTRIRGMNIAAAVAREYLKQVARPRIWPAYVARLVEATLSLMGQRIMALIRKIERSGTLVDGNNIQGRYTRSRSRRRKGSPLA